LAVSRAKWCAPSHASIPTRQGFNCAIKGTVDVVEAAALRGTEWDFFSRNEDPFFKDPVDDSVRPVINERRVDLVNEKHRVTNEVWLKSTPGHTPGHFAIRIASKGEDAVISGDLMHHPVQCRYPEWDDNFDNDGPMAKRTRRAFCERYTNTKTLVFGTHFAMPSPGKIVRKDDSFRFVIA
jgi:glyoxylase-like metal-dependent hydrolase (beta-lactamase superfamily II)